MFLSVYVLFACNEEAFVTTIPYAPVSFKVDLDGLDGGLKGALNVKIFTTDDKRTDFDRFGYAGVFLVRNATDNDLYAFDLCCPYDAADKTRVEPNTSGGAVCPKCGSVYVTLYGRGDVKSGPSQKSLQVYRVIRDKMRENSYYITN
ncbi:MAG: hypothetical protein PHO94_04705 [Petrimonas sp.]|nr:hypothetical protein [Petrimonas sp.]